MSNLVYQESWEEVITKVYKILNADGVTLYAYHEDEDVLESEILRECPISELPASHWMRGEADNLIIKGAKNDRNKR